MLADSDCDGYLDEDDLTHDDSYFDDDGCIGSDEDGYTTDSSMPSLIPAVDSSDDDDEMDGEGLSFIYFLSLTTTDKYIRYCL